MATGRSTPKSKRFKKSESLTSLTEPLPFSPPPVLIKRDFVERYAAGEFGNASPTWNTLKEFLATKPREDGTLYHVRSRIAGGKTYYNHSLVGVKVVWGDLEEWGQSRDFYISAMCPTERTKIQGEVLRGIRGLELTYSTVAKPMRDALKEETLYASGLRAVMLLKARMNRASWEWLDFLLETYPDHVVEFTTFDTNWGTIPGYNTVFWEVRKY